MLWQQAVKLTEILTMQGTVHSCSNLIFFEVESILLHILNKKKKKKKSLTVFIFLSFLGFGEIRHDRSIFIALEYAYHMHLFFTRLSFRKSFICYKTCFFFFFFFFFLHILHVRSVALVVLLANCYVNTLH